MADGADGVFHTARLDGFVAGCKAPIAISGREDLEEGNGIKEFEEPRVDCEGIGEGNPELPMTIGGCGTARNNSGADRCLDKAKISAEFMGALRG